MVGHLIRSVPMVVHARSQPACQTFDTNWTFDQGGEVTESGFRKRTGRRFLPSKRRSGRLPPAARSRTDRVPELKKWVIHTQEMSDTYERCERYIRQIQAMHTMHAREPIARLSEKNSKRCACDVWNCWVRHAQRLSETWATNKRDRGG